MRRRIHIYLDHASHLTAAERKWVRDQEAKRSNQKNLLKQARRIVRAA